MRAILIVIIAALVAACAAPPPGNKGPGDDQGPKRFPMSWDYPPGTMERVNFTAGAPEHWRLSALRTTDRPQAHWKIVIITGTPSWSEYWAPTIAALGPDREIEVADRPGFAESEPKAAVPSIAKQAEALAPMLDARPGERVLLLGQSYGAAISVLMAQAHPDKVDALVLASAYFDDRGPTARRMYGVGQVVQFMLPHDLKNSITEVRHQPAQLDNVYAALGGLKMPVLFVHGDADSFITLSSAQRVAERFHRPLTVIPHGDHFLNACCVEPLIGALEQAIAMAETQTADAAQPGAAGAGASH